MAHRTLIHPTNRHFPGGMAKPTERRACANRIQPGALVQSATLSPDGVFKAVVREVGEFDGQPWASGPGWFEWQKKLVVLREPLKR